jgi:hypothetical protein
MRQGGTASSGARVVAAGSLDFATGLTSGVHGTGVENSGLRHFAALASRRLASAEVEAVLGQPLDVRGREVR